jgi:hypothetical protein
MQINFDYKNCNSLLIAIAVFLCSILTSGCSVSKIEPKAPYRLKLLDEYIMDNHTEFEHQEIGGLSGIDFNGENYVLVSDHSTNPVIFKSKIVIENHEIKDVQIVKATTISCDSILSFDTESIRFLDKNNAYLIVGEGNIDKGHHPVIFEINQDGECTRTYQLPKFFQAGENGGPRNNRVFEGLSLNHDNSGFWVINELPLKRDGTRPKLFDTNSPLRLTHYLFNEDQPNLQLSYDLERIIRLPLLPFGINGATEILQIDERHLLILERAYSAGHKSRSNRIKIFLVDISNRKNLLNVESLKNHKMHNLSKTLIFDSGKIRKQFKYKFIDNIEGMSLGPELENGNKSLILVSDNNFNVFGNQINQFLLFELSKN